MMTRYRGTENIKRQAIDQKTNNVANTPSRLAAARNERELHLIARRREPLDNRQ